MSNVRRERSHSGWIILISSPRSPQNPSSCWVRKKTISTHGDWRSPSGGSSRTAAVELGPGEEFVWEIELTPLPRGSLELTL